MEFQFLFQFEIHVQMLLQIVCIIPYTVYDVFLYSEGLILNVS
jgi:hypothetical protein